MADQDFLDALNDCIDRLATGQSVEDCARRYPEYAAELRPRLETRALVRRAQPSSMEMIQARDRVRFRLENRRRQRRPSFGLARVAGAVLMALILAVMAGGVLAETSLPGDFLYGAKRITENVRVAFAGSPAEAHRQLAARRIEEITRLLALRRAADVEFEGDVEAITGIDWRVAGLALQVMPDVPGAKNAQVGDTVEVQAATTTHGDLIARSVTVIQQQILTPTPSPTPTSTVTATATGVPPSLGLTHQATSTMPQGISATRPSSPAVAPTAQIEDSGHSGSGDGSGSGSGSGDGSGSNSGSSGSGSSPGGSGSDSGSSGSSSTPGGSGSNSGSSGSGSSSGGSGSDSGSGGGGSGSGK